MPWQQAVSYTHRYFLFFLKFFSLKPSAFRSELVDINTLARACQYIFYFPQASLKLNVTFAEELCELVLEALSSLVESRMLELLVYTDLVNLTAVCI